MVEVLKSIPAIQHPWVEPGLTGPLDDAAIVRPKDFAGRALVMTVDVVTPIVDDPRAFGAIAAANSISDVYAMGGRPEVALSFVGFPNDKLPMEMLREVLAGIQDVCAKARCAIVGGHTIADSEPKAGLAVTGSIDPNKVWSHTGARENQALVLTKPIGTGVIGQAIRAGEATPEQVAEAVASMTALNDVACDVGLAFGATSCTDVTGFGLLGHLKHILQASGVSATIDVPSVPLFSGVVALWKRGVAPGGSKRNYAYASSIIDLAPALDPDLAKLLADAQTSGGLLLCIPEDRADDALARLRAEGCVHSAVIGRTHRPIAEPRITLR